MNFQLVWPTWKNNLPTEEMNQAAIKLWAERLHDLTPDEFKSGYYHCLDNLDWPPSIAQFRKAAIRNRPQFDVEDYVRNLMADTGWSEDEARKYYADKFAEMNK